MRLNEEELKALYQEHTARSLAKSECLTADEIARAAAGEINPEERSKITNHMMACSTCAEEYRVLGPIKAWAASFSTEGAHAVAQQSRSGGMRLGTVPEPRVSWWQRVIALSSPVSIVAATCLIVLTLALLAWTVSLRSQNNQMAARLDDEIAKRDRELVSSNEALEQSRRQLEEANRSADQQGSSERLKEYESEIAQLRRDVDELSGPQLDTPIIDLEARGATRDQAGANFKPIELPAGTKLFTLVLNVSGQPRTSSYTAEISDQNGKTIWRGQGLHRSADNTCTLSLSRRLLPDGRYQIKLYAPGVQKEPAEVFAMQIRYR